MIDPAAACARGRARPSRSRTQGDANAGSHWRARGHGDAQVSHAIRVRGVVGSVISEHAGWFSGTRIARLAYEPAGEDHVRADQPDYVAGLDRDADAARAPRPPEDDPVEQD